MRGVWGDMTGEGECGETWLVRGDMTGEGECGET